MAYEMLDTNAYDDSEAVAFIRKNLPKTVDASALSDDDIYYIIDTIFDYLESRGFVAEDEDEEDTCVEIDLDDMIEYIESCCKKDGFGPFDSELIEAVVEAEAQYERSLDD